MLAPLFRATLPLTLQPADDEVGRVEIASVEELQAAYKGKAALIVGGTRGIGRAIADVLADAGAHVLVVGRSASKDSLPHLTGIPADLSTVAGCFDAVASVTSAIKEHPHVDALSFVVCTVGVWPNLSEPRTAEGVDKVVALDLIARHIILTKLAKLGLLGAGCRLMNVLASGQKTPSLLDAESIRTRLEESVLDAEAAAAETAPKHTVGSAGLLLLGTAIAHDAWLQHLAKHAMPADVAVMSTFPGLLVSELPRASLPGWLVPILHAAMLPVADSPEQMGRNHASILARANQLGGRVSYWAAPLLQARKAHPLAYDDEFAAWVHGFVEKVIESRAPAGN